MSTFEIIKEFGIPIFIFLAVLIGGILLLFFTSKDGFKAIAFMGYTKEQIGTIKGGTDRPDDCITVYKLKGKYSGEVNWGLEVITKSKKFHGISRFSGDIPLILTNEEVEALIKTFEDNASRRW